MIMTLAEALRYRDFLLHPNTSKTHILQYSNAEDICQTIPNRPPSLLLEKAVIINGNGLKAVGMMTVTEERCAGHYPGFPILPFAQQAELIGQTGALLLNGACKKNFTGTTPLAVANTEFRSCGSGPIFPGERLFVITTLCKLRVGYASVQAVIFKEGADGMTEIVATMDELKYRGIKIFPTTE